MKTRVFLKKKKRNERLHCLFLTRDCFPEFEVLSWNKEFWQSCISQKCFGQEVFIDFTRNANFQLIANSLSHMTCGKGDKSRGIRNELDSEQNLQQPPKIREDTVGEGCWSVLWHAATCTASGPASSSISLEIEVNCTSMLSSLLWSHLVIIGCSTCNRGAWIGPDYFFSSSCG